MGHYDDDYSLEAAGFSALRSIWTRNNPNEVKELEAYIKKQGLENACKHFSKKEETE
jgi:hypothetical protein